MTFAVKIAAMVKESFVASFYGTGTAYDAFIVALLIPLTLVGLISGSLSSALIPTYIEVRERDGQEAAHKLYSTALMWNTSLLFCVSLLVGLTAHLWLPIVASGFNSDKLALTKSLLYWSLPIVIITGFSTAWGALLNAGERFGVVAFAPAMQPISIFGALLILNRTMGIYALLVGTVIGAAMEATIIGIFLARRGHPLLPKVYEITGALRKLVKNYWATLAGASIMTAWTITDQAMAAMLGPGSNAALSYGSKVPMILMGLGGSALGTALLPQLSQFVAKKNWSEFRHTVWTYVRLTALVSISVALLFMTFSHSLVAMLFQRGSFTAEDTFLVSQIQMVSLLRLPISTVGIVFLRSITALKLNYILTYIAIGQVLLNVYFNYVFMYRYGVSGIALSSVVVSAFSFCIIMYVVVKITNKTSGSQAK
jgi:putative peptidoglycan lipid II flippase